jgi:hypothetical protein
VRQSLFGHLERSKSLRDGDKTGIFFSEVSKSVCPVKRKDNPPARQSRPSWTRRPRSMQSELCQRQLCGEEGQSDHQDLCSVNRVRRRLQREERKENLQQGEVVQVGQDGQDLGSVNRVRRQLCGEEGQRDHQDLCSGNRVGRQLGGEERE